MGIKPTEMSIERKSSASLHLRNAPPLDLAPEFFFGYTCSSKFVFRDNLSFDVYQNQRRAGRVEEGLCALGGDKYSFSKLSRWGWEKIKRRQFARSTKKLSVSLQARDPKLHCDVFPRYFAPYGFVTLSRENRYIYFILFIIIIFFFITIDDFFNDRDS